MAVHGYVTHAAYNRRLTAFMVAAYLAAFQLIAVFTLTWFLLIVDDEHTVLSNPAGYALRYAMPVAIVTALVFYALYRGHAEAVRGALSIRLVDRSDEPRFVTIAEAQCTALGVRAPRFGVIERTERNALSVGEGPSRGLIAVTRGLIDALDDDELAAVLAHEASHIRQGDTRVLAANHALMRTAVILQTNNILRLEDWRQLFIPICLPATLPLFLVSGAATMSALRVARYARRGLKLTRDHVADGEAIRVTHFPEALVTALRKISGRGRFEGSDQVEGLLFDGQSDHEGGSHPTMKDRVAAITGLGAGLLQPNRLRRDTRTPLSAASQPLFGARPLATTPRPRPAMTPAPASGLMLFLFDRPRFRQLQMAAVDAREWRTDDRRNMFGLMPNMVWPVLATAAIIVAMHWPHDGDFSKLGHQLGPGWLVDMAREVNGGPSCSGPGYPDGKCHS